MGTRNSEACRREFLFYQPPPNGFGLFAILIVAAVCLVLAEVPSVVAAPPGLSVPEYPLHRLQYSLHQPARAALTSLSRPDTMLNVQPGIGPTGYEASEDRRPPGDLPRSERCGND